MLKEDHDEAMYYLKVLGLYSNINLHIEHSKLLILYFIYDFILFLGSL